MTLYHYVGDILCLYVVDMYYYNDDTVIKSDIFFLSSRNMCVSDVKIFFNLKKVMSKCQKFLSISLNLVLKMSEKILLKKVL